MDIPQYRSDANSFPADLGTRVLPDWRSPEHIRDDSVPEILFNRGLALCLLLPALPILWALWCVYVLTDRKGGPFLYRGTRLGMHKREFTIFKVRTLARSAEARLGDRLCRSSDDLHTPYGDFLRRTRLDEIPQLFNILRGDMNFVGPRPERLRVYRAHAALIPDYDKRFSVRPGLTGISQFFTPHGTSKRMRAKLDNRFLRAGRRPNRILGLMALTAVRMAWNLVAEVSGSLRFHLLRWSGAYPEKGFWGATARYETWSRAKRRVGTTLGGELVDLDDKELLIRTTRDLPPAGDFDILAPHPRRRGRILRVRCEGETDRRGLDHAKGTPLVVIRYRARGDLDLYRLEKYVLRTSFG